MRDKVVDDAGHERPEIAKLTPILASAARVKIAATRPTKAPSPSTSAPPEEPGLSTASVWMKSSIRLKPIPVRRSAETTPQVTVRPTPKGSLTAQTRAPSGRLLAHRQRRQVLADLEQRHIRRLVAAHDLGGQFAPVGEADEDASRPGHDVEVGRDVAARRG